MVRTFGATPAFQFGAINRRVEEVRPKIVQHGTARGDRGAAGPLKMRLSPLCSLQTPARQIAKPVKGLFWILWYKR